MAAGNPFFILLQAFSFIVGAPAPGTSTCLPSRWVSEPAKIANGRYGAEITATCMIHPQLGGDLGKLAGYELDQVWQRATIHAGPVAETFEGIPSQFVDLTAQGAGKNFSVEVRTDLHVATDLTSRFVSASRSTRIQGTGYGEFLKAASTRVQIQKGTVESGDVAVITVKGEISKPWYIPEGTLLSEARKRGPSEYDRGVIQAADEIAKNY